MTSKQEEKRLAEINKWTFWRFDVIKHLLKLNKGKKYLEIGVEDGDNLRQIKTSVMHGVDPASKNATHHQTSDEFFEMLHPEYKYDVVFVDGLHVAAQAQRDIENALDHLNDGGFVVVHDCNPPNEWYQRSEAEAAKNGFRKWNGDVYKAIVNLRVTRDDLYICVVDTDYGCGIVKKVSSVESNKLLDSGHDGISDIDYQWFDENREQLLNLISVEQFKDQFK